MPGGLYRSGGKPAAKEKEAVQAMPLDAALTAAIATKNADKVRAVWEDHFWQGGGNKPGWPHLKAALETGNIDIVRVLKTWGGQASPENLAAMKTESPEKYPQYLNLLWRAGLRLPREMSMEARKPLPAPATAGAAITFNKNGKQMTVPQDWQAVLKGFEAAGTPHAFIAGGALRDLITEKPIRDIDVFAEDRGSREKNRILVQKAFENAGIGAVKKTEVHDGYSATTETRSHTITEAGENWIVEAGGATYNIIFKQKMQSLLDTVKGFDIGLCQIGYNGALFSTNAFEKDLMNQTLTVCNKTPGWREHLQRVVQKYPDYKPSVPVPQTYQPGDLVPGEGIYIGKYEPKDREGKSLSKAFNVFAAPEDLPETMKYVDAVKHIAKLKKWNGYDGTNYATDKEFYAAVKNDSYDGGWIIPPRSVLSSKYLDEKDAAPGNIFEHKDKGAPRGTFKMKTSIHGDYLEWYWTSTNYPGDSKNMMAIRFSDGGGGCFSTARMSCRLVRLVEVAPTQIIHNVTRVTEQR